MYNQLCYVLCPCPFSAHTQNCRLIYWSLFLPDKNYAYKIFMNIKIRIHLLLQTFLLKHKNIENWFLFICKVVMEIVTLIMLKKVKQNTEAMKATTMKKTLLKKNKGGDALDHFFANANDQGFQQQATKWVILVVCFRCGKKTQYFVLFSVWGRMLQAVTNQVLGSDAQRFSG